MGTHPFEPASMGTHSLRLFFALWPSSTLRRALAVAAGPVARLAEIGGQGGYPAIELDFDQLEYWPKPKVLVAMPSRVPPVGTAMVERLWQRIEPLGFARDTRSWRPHLTLARKIHRPPPDGLRFGTGPLPTGEAARWGLALVESVTHPHGARYRPLAEWPLG